MSLLRPRPNRRLDRCQSWALSLLHSLSFSLSLPLSFLSFVSRSLLSSLPLPLLHLSSSFSLSLRNISLRISAPGSHGKQCTARRPRKHPLLLSRRRGREEESGREDRAAIHAGSEIYFRDQKLSAHRFGNEYRRSRIFRMPREIPRNYARFDLSARCTLNSSSNAKCYRMYYLSRVALFKILNID